MFCIFYAGICIDFITIRNAILMNVNTFNFLFFIIVVIEVSGDRLSYVNTNEFTLEKNHLNVTFKIVTIKQEISSAWSINNII